VDDKNSRSFKMEGKGMDISVNENSPMKKKKKKKKKKLVSQFRGVFFAIINYYFLKNCF
jgi:ABC-type nitrate/sulfonate/bicarbonate transport system substrate-binding protein